MSRFDKLLKTAKQSDSQTPEQPDSQTPKAKSSDPNYSKATLYLTKGTHRRLKLAALENGQEMSTLAEAAIVAWLESRQPDV